MEACQCAANQIYDNIWASRSLQDQSMNALVANPNLLHQSMENNCQTLMFYMTLMRHVSKSILSKNNVFVPKHMFLPDLLMLGLMLGLMFPDALFHFQHSCINLRKRNFPNMNVLLEIVAACAQIYFVPKQFVFVPKHLFFYQFY